MFPRRFHFDQPHPAIRIDQSHLRIAAIDQRSGYQRLAGEIAGESNRYCRPSTRKSLNSQIHW